jgi:hypothetical protein
MQLIADGRDKNGKGGGVSATVDLLSAFKSCLKTYLFKQAIRLQIFNLI